MKTSIDKEKIAVQYLFESEPEHTWTAKEIQHTLGFRAKQITRLHEYLKEMVREGVIVHAGGKMAFTLAKQTNQVTGPLRMVRNGAGNVTDRETGETVWVEAEDLGTALPGDLVTLRLFRRSGEIKGKVSKIVERSPHDVVGTLCATENFFYVVPLNPVYKKDFYVREAKGAKEGDRVVLRFTGWEDRYGAPEGDIIDVIGPADKPSLDTEVVMRQFELPESCPPHVLAEAEKVALKVSRPGKREDLRDLFILTIDPASARDYDDAISLTHDEKGRRVLGVHIADVSHFVRPKSALDAEAQARGTSVYLVDKVIPMLPEQLSNGVCSLRPNEDRLTFSVFMTFDGKGKMIGRRFTKSKIRSKQRLCYEQAYAILKGEKPEHADEILPETPRLIREAWELAHQLREERFSHSALDLDVPEAEVQLDGEGRMTAILVRPYDESHQMIEEFMVAANEAVATELWTKGIKILARLHEPPDEEKIEDLQAGLAVLGFRPGDLSNATNLAHFLKSIADHPLRHEAGMLILRSMKRAVYSGEQIGHFGLAKTFYAHFTSPIRRYPDLVLHRQLAEYLAGKSGRIPKQELNRLALLTTEREQVADDASRQLVEIKKFRFLQQQLDDHSPVEYSAVISKCTNYGIFVEVTDLAMSGMVHISHLSRGFVRFNSETETLSAGQRSYRVGQELRVIVESVDFNQRRADFVLSGADAIDQKPRLRAKRERPPKRGKTGRRVKPGRKAKTSAESEPYRN